MVVELRPDRNSREEGEESVISLLAGGSTPHTRALQNKLASRNWAPDMPVCLLEYGWEIKHLLCRRWLTLRLWLTFKSTCGRARGRGRGRTVRMKKRFLYRKFMKKKASQRGGVAVYRFFSPTGGRIVFTYHIIFVAVCVLSILLYFFLACTYACLCLSQSCS